jgi:YHS domain-containing protein
MVDMRSTWRRRALLLGLATLSLVARAGGVVSGADKGPALEGHDPVAYFTDQKPVPGDARFETQWHGATWRFASAEHRDLFTNEPERYAPQYGGYCAYAMSNGAFSPGDAKRWRIVDDKLYLNTNLIAQSLWESNIPKRVREADGHWPTKKQELEARP